MNKNQIIMAATGGAALLASLAIVYFVSAAGSDREEAIGELETQKNIFAQNRDASREEERAVRANAAAVREWTAASAQSAASVTGVIAKVEHMSASVFKTHMLEDVRRYQRLPDGAKVKILAAGDTAIDQAFPDFKDYIIGNSMPEAPELERRWVEICMVIDSLVGCGAESFLSVRVDTQKPAAPDAKGKGAAAEAKKTAFDVSEEKYTFVFTARPDALVRILNALAVVERFVSVDSLSFAQEPDPLVAVLGGSTKDKDEKAAPRRGRGRGRSAAADEKSEDAAAEKLRYGTVTNPADPLSSTPFKVTMSVSTLAVSAESGKKEVSE